MNQAQVAKMTVKIPPDVRQWLEAQAAYNVTSMTAEVIKVIRDRMARERRDKVAG
jgi:hypothetical protein